VNLKNKEFYNIHKIDPVDIKVPVVAELPIYPNLLLGRKLSDIRAIHCSFSLNVT
jgi:hypothetical protein